MILNTNKIEIIVIVQETSLNLPVIAFKTTYETIPNTIPSAILPEKGIIIIVKNAGILSV